MNYRVKWKRRAKDQLALLWIESKDRSAITVASHTLDQRLALNPQDAGESRVENRWIAFEPPLQIIYRIDETQRLVKVERVAHFGRSK